ncbi:Transcriptional regulatory protein BaeR [Thermoflexales bacterium]|nr:Transcriptional regulatory protein BaeR [Thermoflexales bacterium]
MTHLTALIIEDEPKLGVIYDTVLRQAGYETEIIRRGDEALQRLRHTTPTLILLDIHLPYVSGLDLLKVIRVTESLAKTPVIVLTADLYLAQTLEDQADYVLIKSFGVSRLRELVTRLASANTSSTGNADATC